MNRPFFAGMHPVLQLLILVLITLVSYFVFAIIGILIVVGFYDISLAQLIEAMGSAGVDDVGILKILQITQSIGIFIIPAFLIAWTASKNPGRFLGFSTPLDLRALGLMLLVLMSIQPVVIYSGVLNQEMHLPDFLSGIESWMKNMEDRAMELTESFLTVTQLSGLLINLLMIAILPGLGEELFFRGLLQKLFSKWFRNVHVAVFLTAILFSALHMQFYGFLPRFLLGLLFGYLLVWSGNIWFPIIAHMLHNSLPVVLYYLYARDLTGTDFEEVGTGSSAGWWALAGVIFLVIFSCQFKRIFQELKPNYSE